MISAFNKDDSNTVQCPKCLKISQDYEIAKLKVCSNCHSKRDPHYLSQNVTVTLNWEEVRLLTMMASNAAMEYLEDDDVLQEELVGILAKLTAVKPEGAAPLTIEELTEEAKTEKMQFALVKPTTKAMLH